MLVCGEVFRHRCDYFVAFLYTGYMFIYSVSIASTTFACILHLAPGTLYNVHYVVNFTCDSMWGWQIFCFVYPACVFAPKLIQFLNQGAIGAFS